MSPSFPLAPRNLGKTRYTRPVIARTRPLSALLGVALLAAAVGGHAAAPVSSKPGGPTLPPMPGSGGKAPEVPSPSPSASSAAPGGGSPSTAERAPAHPDPAVVARSVVNVERREKPLAIGVVLARDGRVLTAYSPLGDARDLDVRYADGSVVRARIELQDLGWDLALLAPAAGRQSDGLSPSQRDPLQSNASLIAFTPAKRHVMSSPIVLKGHRTLVGAGEALLREAFELGTKVSPAQLGSPIVDDAGMVVGTIGRACAPVENGNGGCTLVPFGAPIDAIRKFLRQAPPPSLRPQPWLGMQVVADSMGAAKGLRVQVVRPESPAEDAGLRGGEREKADLVVALDGVPVTTPEALSDAIRDRAVGDRISLLIFSDGRYRTVSVLLQPAPAGAGSVAAPMSSSRPSTR